MFKLKKVISNGEMRPPFYGFAYEEDLGHVVVCYPVPLNWLVGLWVEFVWRLTRGPRGWKNKELKILLRAEYEKGYGHGLIEGHNAYNTVSGTFPHKQGYR